MAYTRTGIVVDDVTDATAEQYNSLRAELKAAAIGLLLSSTVVWTIAYNANGTINTITGVDAEADANHDLDVVGTYAYNVDGTVNTVTWVFSKMAITFTETYAYTDGKITTITPSFS